MMVLVDLSANSIVMRGLDRASITLRKKAF